ncbi:MAG: hypothetical protein HY210_03510, partial [Candidatus Omnitrophica bacterium]|nr:hypothetical protein [Candidatus Omnitrophota bacterium]
MLSYLLILMALALLVGGIAFVITGWSGSPDDAVVAIADLEEFKAWTSAPSYEEKVALESIPESPPAAPVAQKQEIFKGYPEKLADLEIQLHALEETMAGKAAVDQDKITRLAYENNKLKKQAQEREAEFSRLTVEIEAARKAYEHLLAQEGSKAEDFQKNIAR